MEYMKPKHPMEQEAIRKAVALDHAVEFVAILNPEPEKAGEELRKTYELFYHLLCADVPQPTKLASQPTEKKTKSKTEGTLPTPTLKQKEVLNAIHKRLGGDKKELAEKVLGWAEKVKGTRKYPENMTSVEECVKWLGD